MIAKPPQMTAANASAFALQSVVDTYHLRTPYPPELASALLGLVTETRSPILELGCGTGAITRALAPHVARIDAVDVSAPMLARARSMRGGDAPSIHWIEGRAETFEFEGPYALAVSGDALGWMDWEVVLPAIGRSLVANARLVLVTAVRGSEPWDDALLDVIRRHSIYPEFESYSLPERLANLGLWTVEGGRRVGPTEFTRTVDDFVEALHATGGLPRDRMTDSAGFDVEVQKLLAPYALDGVLELKAYADLTCGRPVAG